MRDRIILKLMYYAGMTASGMMAAGFFKQMFKSVYFKEFLASYIESVIRSVSAILISPLVDAIFFGG